ncbi:MAG: FAD-dependent monooxygenase [Bacteroidia bacterium]|nr:FAD-dependent monooxygenase [Bacteroidia bacterium]
MSQFVDITLSPAEYSNDATTKRLIARKLSVKSEEIFATRLRRRSIDARKGNVKFVLRYEVWLEQPVEEAVPPVFEGQQVANADPVHIIGAGPAGLFAALELIRLGKKPIVIERGKAVRERRRDLATLNKEGIVNPESNYCFGEGGAGTFSDGKLYTRSTKRGDVRRVLDLLVQFGATEEILIDAHPHIGTNKLPKIIEAMRDEIIACGGEVRFDCKLTDLKVVEGKMHSICLNGGEWERAEHLILATGHSARDIFTLLHRRGIEIHAKPFALGVRIEHPQEIIDKIQYSCPTGRPEGLPAASYGLVQQVQDRGVYSFCMCPGGIICPAATAEGELVVNGWSPSMRNTGFANSGMVVELQLQDIPGTQQDPLAAMAYQAAIEQRAFVAGGGRQVAPAQRMADFINGSLSSSLPDCSYLPGITSVDLAEVLPERITKRLRGGLQAFGQKMKGYLTNEAVLVGVESRTSSSVSIPRDSETLMHPQVRGLYPCGEGAGYAGGIMSAALDGERCARATVAVE